MRFRITTILAIIVLAGAGCAARGVSRHRPAPRDRHLLFNPQWNLFPIVDTTRSDWPSALVNDPGGDIVEYTEMYVDLEGRSRDVRNDVPYRRFKSIRTGRARR